MTHHHRSTTSTRRARGVFTAVVLLAASATLSGCGDSDSGSDATTLRVAIFGDFGYESLYDQFEKDHPGVKIVETSEGDLGKYNTALTQKIAAGSAPGDVVAIEEGQVVNFLQSADAFVNFQDHGSNERKDQWLDWKYAQATTADGTRTIGLGTDVGGMAMCYRRDLFEEAGLPTERNEVGALWPTWEAFTQVGEQFQQAVGRDDVHFIDSATNTYNSILMQTAEETYFDQDDELVIESNPAVRAAWDTSLAMADAGISARLKSFSTEWNAGFKNGSFATIACPAWMTNYIKEQAGEDNAGTWDITTVPGGGGNWGGSFLGVPTTSKQRELAIELVDFLTSADGQLGAFEATGNLPSNPTLYSTPELQEATNPYFNDAPVGQIFVAGASSLTPVYLGAKNQPVRDAVENAMRSVENGETSPDEGWAAAVEDAEKAAG